MLEAHIANPGRMEEFRVSGHPFFLVPSDHGKYPFRVVSTLYQGAFVLLDTIKVNHIVETLLRQRLINQFAEYSQLKREVPFRRSKFDFLLQGTPNRQAILEVKSCNLCHQGIAMFPDAPTLRGTRHLQDLERLGHEGNETYILYLISNPNAIEFRPNVHTDPEYCRTFIASKKVKSLAYKIGLIDPITIDLESLKPVPLDLRTTLSNCRDKGSYVLILENETEFSSNIGSLGKRRFRKGFYIYVGSALSGLEARIQRHQRRGKKIHWHLDYIVPYKMKICKIHRIRRADRIESSLAKRMEAICDGFVHGFGAADSANHSHLFYFSRNPAFQRTFLDTIFDFQMMVE